MDHEEYKRKVNNLATDIHCGTSLAKDLLILAGNDDELVREASSMCNKVESMKAYIINGRFKKNELK